MCEAGCPRHGLGAGDVSTVARSHPLCCLVFAFQVLLARGKCCLWTSCGSLREIKYDEEGAALVHNSLAIPASRRDRNVAARLTCRRSAYLSAVGDTEPTCRC